MTTAPADWDAKFERDAWIRALQRTADIETDLSLTLPVLIERLALEFDAAPALMSSDGSLNYGELAARSNQYARWGLAQGLKCGDVAALLIPNCAEYVAVWLGLTCIGVTVALLNTHLASDGLVHSIKIVAPRLVVVGAELAPSLAAVRTRVWPNLGAWAYGTGAPDFLPLEPRSRALLAGGAGGDRLHGADARHDGALHLHLWHHRPAEGGPCHALPADALEPVVCRVDGYQCSGPDVQLPAALS